jgi:hypothetical protein
MGVRRSDCGAVPGLKACSAMCVRYMRDCVWDHLEYVWMCGCARVCAMAHGVQAVYGYYLALLSLTGLVGSAASGSVMIVSNGDTNSARSLPLPALHADQVRSLEGGCISPPCGRWDR